MIAGHLLIREAIPGDRIDILDVNRRTWETCYAHIFSVAEINGLFRNILPQHGSWIQQRGERLGMLVVEIDSQITGFIGMASLADDTHSAEITTFYVLPEYQRHGVGKRLWLAALEHLQSENYRGVWVWTLARAGARHFYAAQGCTVAAHGTYSVGVHQEPALGYYLPLTQ